MRFIAVVAYGIPSFVAVRRGTRLGDVVKLNDSDINARRSPLTFKGDI